MGAYDILASSPEISAAQLQGARFVALGNFFDVLIRNGRWIPAGTLPVPEVPYPCHKVKMRDQFWVCTWDSMQRRVATPEELTRLEYQTNYGPIFLENALKRHAGEPFDAGVFSFDLLDPVRVREASLIF